MVDDMGWLNCMCENGNCKHGDTLCDKYGNGMVYTIYGNYWMCRECFANMPAKYLTNIGQLMSHIYAKR